MNSYEDTNNKREIWNEIVWAHIIRAEERIKNNRIFSKKYVNIVKIYFKYFEEYFSRIKPLPFFDDLTTKNVLIDNGKISRKVDIDWIFLGDRLYAITLCHTSLLNMNCDLSYINYWKTLEKLTENKEKTVLSLYFSILYWFYLWKR